MQKNKTLGTIVLTSLLMVGLVSAVFMTAIANTNAASVVPTFVAGNPKCTDIDPSWTELKVDPPRGGSYSSGGKSASLTISGLIVTSWTTSAPVTAVIVKGGPNANVYTYEGGATSDTDLHAPTNPKNGKYYGLSHISFCFGTIPPPQCYDYNGNVIPCE
jgi:hypothetical protein